MNKIILKRRLLLATISAFVFCTAFAPPSAEKNILKKANKYFFKEKYDLAYPAYEELAKGHPDNFLYNYRTGLCYFHSINSANKAKALSYFEAAKKNMTSKSDPEIYYYLGQVYQLHNRFDEAIECYTKLKSVIVNKGLGAKQIKEADRFIETCNTGKELVKKPLPVRIENAGPNINSEFPDYAPVISSDESSLIFTSKREGTTGGKKDEDGYYFEDIFSSKKIGETGWIPSYKLDTMAETPKRGFFKILFSKAENIGNSVNTKTHDASIAISADGKKLFIFRKNHIWMSTHNGTKWGKPAKLNENINAKKSYEPSITLSAEESIIYFVSERKGGFGGKDIYRSFKQADGSWGKAENLGPTINTKYDEESPFIALDGKTLYFSSEGHESMGRFDIFKTVLENNSWTTPQNLGYPINTASDDIFYVTNADNNRAYYSTIKHESKGDLDIYMISKEVPRPQIKILSVVRSDNPTKTNLSIKNIKFKNDASTYLIPSDGGKYEIQISPADTFLFTIASEDLSPKTLTLSLPEETKDVHYYQEIIHKKTTGPDGRVINTTKVYNAFFDIDKEIANMPELAVKPKDEAYSAYIHSLETPGALPGLKIYTFSDTIAEATAALTASDTLDLKPILFESAKTELDPGTQNRLDEVIEYLKRNENISVELVGHTDSKAEEEFNKRLSLQRARTVGRYFTSKGINSKRVSERGLGEVSPASSNTNTDGTDNPEGRKLNRRVEIRLKQK